MENNILYNYEMLTSDLLTSVGALEIVYRWLDELPGNKLGYYEFSEFKSQYAERHVRWCERGYLLAPTRLLPL